MWGVYHKCQCPLFKQFTTMFHTLRSVDKVFIISVNVLFLSNSQLIRGIPVPASWCLS